MPPVAGFKALGRPEWVKRDGGSMVRIERRRTARWPDVFESVLEVAALALALALAPSRLSLSLDVVLLLSLLLLLLLSPSLLLLLLLLLFGCVLVL